MMLPNSKRKSNATSLNVSSNLVDPDYGFYVETYFKERLSLERQRTERSKKPILLMLLYLQDFGQKEKSEVTGKIKQVLFSSTREIDLKGWHRFESVIGVLFTEMNGTDIDTFRDKTHKNLCSRLKLDQVKKIKITFHVFPEENDGERLSSPSNLVFYPDFTEEDSSRESYSFAKRVIDVLGSIAALFILSPFFVLISILIKLSSKGPILFRQERIGLHGKKFTFLKFRSMYLNNDAEIHKEYIHNLIKGEEENGNNGASPDNNRIYKIRSDSRVTPLGNLLRKSSLDEIPQFFNVLKGEMSLVGPRPPIPYELGKYDIWHRRRVLGVKPGVSGLWQVKGRSSTTFNEMVRLDLKYSREMSIWLDIKILLKTPWVVLTGRGAY